jgi:hypothetical protein
VILVRLYSAPRSDINDVVSPLIESDALLSFS